jgi:hypothetical protein
MLIRSFAPIILGYDFALNPAERPNSPVADVPMNLRLEIFSFMVLLFEDYIMSTKLFSISMPVTLGAEQVNFS